MSKQSIAAERGESDGSSLSEERLGGVASGESRASLPLAFELAAIAARSFAARHLGSGHFDGD